MISHPAACRIRRVFPKAKIIAVLRDPVQVSCQAGWVDIHFHVGNLHVVQGCRRVGLHVQHSRSTHC